MGSFGSEKALQIIKKGKLWLNSLWDEPTNEGKAVLVIYPSNTVSWMKHQDWRRRRCMVEQIFLQPEGKPCEGRG